MVEKIPPFTNLPPPSPGPIEPQHRDLAAHQPFPRFAKMQFTNDEAKRFWHTLMNQINEAAKKDLARMKKAIRAMRSEDE